MRIRTRSVIAVGVAWHYQSQKEAQMPLESYVVRIYRRPGGRRHGLVGLVEAVGMGGKQAFTNAEELWAILSTQPCGKVKTANTSIHKEAPCKVTPIGTCAFRQTDEGEGK